MDALRKQLDALMGANRNGDVREVKRKYYDRDVCRLYLTGLCPHDLFQLTKMDLGPCSKFHSLQLRKEYEEAKAQGKDSYDRELEECLEKHILECDRKIARALKRLEDDDVGAATAIAVSEVTKSSDACEYTRQIKEKLKEAEYLDLEGKTDEKIRILEVVEELRSKRADRQAMSLLEAFSKDRALMPQPLPNPPPLAPLPMMAASAPDARTQELIKQKLKVAEELGEQGRVDEAEKAMEEAEALKKLGSRQDLSADPSKVATQDVRVVQADQKLRVCDICGAFLSIYDSDRRLADHFGGKLHLGYMQIREKLVDLKEQRTRHLNEKDGHDDKGRGRDGQSNSDEQERDWGKVKDQEKDRQGSRVQEPEHQNRGRDKDGDREPEFRRGYLASGRDGDRGRDRKRRREREDDRERDDDGNRHGGRYVDRNYKDRSHTEQGHNRFYRHRTGGYRDGDRDRDGDNRDRDRDRDRWERDRERNREKEKERDRDRAKEKERERGPVERDRARDRD